MQNLLIRSVVAQFNTADEPRNCLGDG